MRQESIDTALYLGQVFLIRRALVATGRTRCVVSVTSLRGTSPKINILSKILTDIRRTNDFSMRPEQKEAVDKTEAYFRSAAAEGYPKFLWNCKMRFGKTFASYQLAKKMGFKRILILTFKPAVVSAWQEY